ncbi:MAG TPA: reverse transcriptase family protein [Planctomycetaceae bacterium]|nr:reverse transcriptase family protein [Planctomycetaceae bacterium]
MDWLLPLVIVGTMFLLFVITRGLGGLRQRASRRASRSRRDAQRRHARLFGFTRGFAKPRSPRSAAVYIAKPPRAFCFRNPRTGIYLDLAQDGDAEKLARWKLPALHTAADIAQWLGMPLNRLAWLAHQCRKGRADGVRQSHYHYTWRKKRTGGVRLIESPKRELRAIQRKILREMLDLVPVSNAAQGFVKKCSIRTHAAVHQKPALLLRFDLKDFYASVTFNRVVAIFRTLGYSREVAIWLARLTTAAIPTNLTSPKDDPLAAWRYRRRHLPQGAPTSPALANLSAYYLDQRLAGLAKSFDARYSRYADDLTFSGDESLDTKLRLFIQLVELIIRTERFHSNRQKRQVLRRHQRQMITGVVVNERPNICRRDFDTLKAILTNCVKSGPASQNRDQHPNFTAHLAGRIAHVAAFHPARAEKLRRLYARIDWSR